VKRKLGEGFEVDDDPARIDVAAVHRFISEKSYWAAGRPYDVMARLVDGASRVVGLYDGDRQIGFCRAVAPGEVGPVYLADVYVLPEYRGRGLGVELVREMVENGPYDDRSWILHTADAHELYRKFGFAEPTERLMERPRPGS
jgi:ribosomal protein S18 acetylase RimI-like enzyme